MPDEQAIVKNRRIKQTVCGWCYPDIATKDLATAAKAMGLVGIDLLDSGQFQIVQDLGLVCTMTNSHTIEVGLNDPTNHDSCLEKINAGIEANQQAGFRNVICFSGNRNGIDDKTGIIDVQMNLQEPDVLLVAAYERQRDGFDGNDPAKKLGPGSGLYLTKDGGGTFRCRHSLMDRLAEAA